MFLPLFMFVNYVYNLEWDYLGVNDNENETGL